MRLLTYNERREISLIERTGDNVPQYAILSHTWGKDEVTYNEMVEGSSKGKLGYSKIKFCVEQAARDGLQYSWVDTCCIDKWNLEELSNEINSMFLWYQNATKCYVFLSDVPLTNTASEILDDITWETDFYNSKWFRRGWTLQELIAPRCIEFFSSQYQRLGDKRSLEQQIHKITGIQIEALRGSSLNRFSTEERMAWTEHRKTTEEEDSAYCLLGIFGVHMPAIYGEGKANALNRLRREVESAKSALFIVPFDQNIQFTGRQSQLAMLDTILFVNGQRAVITGAGGTGKTQLALELAYRTREKYRSCAVLWIPAAGMESLYEGYVHIAQRLGIPGWSDKKVDVKRLVQQYLSQDGVGQWLLIFDNADDVSLWSAEPGPTAGAAGLMQYLPSSKQGYIVFTTRDTETAIKLGAENIVEVPRMDQDVAQALLQKCLTIRNLKEEQQETNLLLRKLNYLPLAITLAGAYINVNKETTLTEYLSLLATQNGKSIGLLSEDPGDDLISHAEQQSLATILLISLEEVCSQNKLAANYMSFIACIEQRDIPLSLLPTGTSSKEDAVKMLTDYSMIIRRPAASALDIHPLVHLATRNWLRKKGQLFEWSRTVIGQLETAFPAGDHWNRGKWRRLLPHASYLLKIIGIEEGNAARAALVWKCAMSLYYDGRYSEAEKLQVQVMKACKTKLGPEHSETLDSMSNLASTYRDQGRWKEAEELEVQVMETIKRVLGTEHPDTLTRMSNLALTYTNQGRWKEAEELNIQVMKTRKLVLGAEHPETLTSIGNLASTYKNQGRWKEAEELEVQVMETRKRVLSTEHPDTLTSMGNLALTYSNQGQWEEAERLNIQVMETFQTKLGADHPSTLTSIGNLALVYNNRGRWKEAEELEVQVMETRKRVLGIEHPDTLTSMGNLALIYSNQGQWEDAERLNLQVMETFQTKLGADHSSTLASMGNLAVLYNNRGRWKEAEELEVQVMETKKRVLGIEHPDTLTSMGNLALTYSNQGQWEDAERLNIQVMETFQTKLGADHSSTLVSMGNLAALYSNRGRWKEAEELEVQVMENRKKKLGEDHPSTLTSMANLASTYIQQGRQEKAESLLKRVMEISIEKLGKDHPSTLASIANLAVVYSKRGQWEKAEELEVQVIENRKKKLGEDHPSTLTSMANLAATYYNQGRWDEAEALIVKVVKIRKEKLGEDHPSTLASMGNLAVLYTNRGRWKEAEELDLQVVEARKRSSGRTISLR